MAVTSETDVANLALNAIGARNNITSLDEPSREAEVCKLWYDAVRDQVLEAAAWPEATRYDYLAVVNKQDDNVWTAGEALPSYTFAYAAPTDMIRPQYLSDYSPFLLTSGAGNQRLLHSNKEQAILVYTARNKLVGTWSSGLRMAVIYGLAAYICMPLSGKTQRTKLMLEQANELILSAREASANANTQQLETVPDWIAARGYNNPGQTRYFYPLGGLLTV